MNGFVVFVVLLVVMAIAKAIGLSDVGAGEILWALLFLAIGLGLIAMVFIYIIAPLFVVFTMFGFALFGC